MRQLRTKRRLCAGAFVLVAAPVLLASVASACTSLINLQANPNSGSAGVSINVTGSNYSTAATSGPVEIRLNSRSGPVVASLPTASINPVGRKISMTVPIPGNAAAGYQTLIATQYNTSTGALLSGFPVRATYRVVAAATKESAGTAEAVDATAPAAAEATTAGADAAPAAVVPPVSATSAAAPAAATAVPAAPSAAATAAPSSAPAPAGAAPGAPVVGIPAATAAVSPAQVLGDPAAPVATVTESAALTVPSASTSAPSVETVSSGLMSAASHGSDSVLPQVTFSIGAAIVLLSLLAFMKSGRTILVGRRLATPA